MTKPLKRMKKECWHFVDGYRISGDVSGIKGDVSGICGDVSDIEGNFNEIPIEDRKEKPNVSDWVEEV